MANRPARHPAGSKRQVGPTRMGGPVGARMRGAGGGQARRRGLAGPPGDRRLARGLLRTSEVLQPVPGIRRRARGTAPARVLVARRSVLDHSPDRGAGVSLSCRAATAPAPRPATFAPVPGAVPGRHLGLAPGRTLLSCAHWPRSSPTFPRRRAATAVSTSPATPPPAPRSTSPSRPCTSPAR